MIVRWELIVLWNVRGGWRGLLGEQRWCGEKQNERKGPGLHGQQGTPMRAEVNGWRGSVLLEGAEVGFGGGWGEEADGDEAGERGDEGGEDGVAVANDGGEVGVDEGSVPEDGDEGSGEDAGYRRAGGGAAPVEGGQDHRSERGRVDGVGVEGFLEDGFGVQALVERPQAEQDDHGAGDEEDLVVEALGLR